MTTRLRNLLFLLAGTALVVCTPSEDKAPSTPGSSDTPGTTTPGTTDDTDPPDDTSDPADTSDTHDTADPGDGPCEPTGAATRSPLRRLSRAQYKNSVNDLVSEFVGEDVGGSDWLAYKWIDTWDLLLPVDLPTGAPDQTRGGYRRLDQDVYQQHAEGWAVVAMGVADEFAMGHIWTIESYFEGDCSPYGDRTCVQRWIEALGPKALRRPLTDDDISFYLSVYDSEEAVVLAENAGDTWKAADAGTVAVTAALLMSPWFTHHVELGDPDADEGTLTAHELANRLSFHFWQTAPDAELRAVANDGTLLDAAVYEAQVRRLVADARTTEAIGEFFDDWLITDHIPFMHARVGTQPYDHFADGYNPNANLHSAMAEELRALGIWHTVTAPTDFESFFRSDLLLTTDSGLAWLYGASEGWSGDGDPPRVTEPERAGLLTRVGLLATGSAHTRPIKKGVFIREQLLCEPIGPPPDDVNAAAPAPDASATTREAVTTLTEVEGTPCAGCHTGLINPLGFATEGFDALGRPRTLEVLYNDDGEPVGSAPIDQSTSVWLDGAYHDVHNATDLTAVLLDSGQAHACFARNTFRFALGRMEHADSEDCTIEELGAALQTGLTLDEFLVQVALLPEFKALAAAGGAE